MTPPITREARDWLLQNIDPTWLRADVMRGLIISMPLTPADPLDAVRARFQSNGIQEITAADGDYALGYNGGYVTVWRVQDGAHWLGRGPAKPLQCLSPHAALIAELRAIYQKGVSGQPVWTDNFEAVRRAADALAKLP